MPLNRTTTRALAASVALVAAGGTVAGAAVFHLPVLGFGPANAGAASEGERTAATIDPAAKDVAPIRVVRTRIVDEISHRSSRTVETPADATAAATAPAAPAATSAPTVGSVSASHDTSREGDDGHESEEDHDRVEHEGRSADGGETSR